VAQTVDGVETRYALDVAGGLPEVIVATTGGASAYYVQVLGQVLGQNDAGAWVYVLPDHLGSVRQLADADGQVSLAQSYDPFGNAFESAGSGQSEFGYTGEWHESYTNLLFLRARYYGSAQGRFLSKDPFPGSVQHPGTLHAFAYVTNNPVNYTDPSGYILDPSDPTHRGMVIHRMTQEQYKTNNPSHGVELEFKITSGSISGKIRSEWDPSIGQRLYYIKDSVPATGYADIVDFTEAGLYEIKPIAAKEVGVVTAAWYLINYNYYDANRFGVALNLGVNYPGPPGIIIGTDPDDPNKWILTQLEYPGVVVYYDRHKRPDDRVPVFVFEWNPASQKVEKRRSARVLSWGEACQGAVVAVGGSIIIVLILDDATLIGIPDDVLILPIGKLLVNMGQKTAAFVPAH
jgi:RHS repeat-associated protein